MKSTSIGKIAPLKDGGTIILGATLEAKASVFFLSKAGELKPLFPFAKQEEIWGTSIVSILDNNRVLVRTGGDRGIGNLVLVDGDRFVEVAQNATTIARRSAEAHVTSRERVDEALHSFTTAS